MRIRRAFRYRLEPTEEQARQLVSYVGHARFVWNKALGINLRRLRSGQRIMRYGEMDFWLKLWKQSEDFGFLREAPSHALQQKLRDLDRAFMDAFDPGQPNKRLPRFKRKGRHDTIRFPDPKQIALDGNRIKLPKLGWMRMRLSRPVVGEIRNATVSLHAGRWFVSIQTEMEVPEPVHPSDTAIGVDLGVANMATLSDGSTFPGAKALKRLDRKLARAQRRLARMQKFSNNWKRQCERIARIHAKISDARMDAIHKATTAISKSHALACLEDLRVRDMCASARGTVDSPGRNVRAKAGLNRSILDAGWGEFRRQLEYKLRWLGGCLVLVDPRHTSQRCSACGHVDAASRPSQAVFRCVACGHCDNADVNAAKNILAAGIAALRQGMSWKPVEGKGIGLPVKQEPEVAATRPLPESA